MVQPSPQPHSHRPFLLPELPHLPAKPFPSTSTCQESSCLPCHTSFPAYCWVLKAVLLLLTSAAPAHPCRESGCISHYPLKCFIAYVKALGSSEFGPNFRITMPLKGKVMGMLSENHTNHQKTDKNIYLVMKSELDGTAGKRMNRGGKNRTKKQTNQPQIHLQFK